MPGSVRDMPDKCTGHGCFPPRADICSSSHVIINGRPAHRVGDGWKSHCCKSCHSGTQATGSSTVFYELKKHARIGDKINCGSSNATGSNNHFVGG